MLGLIIAATAVQALAGLVVFVFNVMEWHYSRNSDSDDRLVWMEAESKRAKIGFLAFITSPVGILVVPACLLALALFGIKLVLQKVIPVLKNEVS